MGSTVAVPVVDNLRRVLDLQGEKLHELTSNNREVMLVACLTTRHSFALVRSPAESIGSFEIGSREE